MKILWVSPWGDGWSIAARMRDAGNKVVYFCPDPENKNGQGYLPTVAEANWLSFAERSDLVIVDGNFPSRTTRRSWEASDYVKDLQQLRHKGITVLGPTPTTELIENDPRYLRKVLGRVGLKPSPDNIINVAKDLLGGVPVTVSCDPEGRCYLVFRHRTLLGDGNGPEVGNLGDVTIPMPNTIKLFRQVVDPLHSFLSRIGYNGYLNIGIEALGSDLSVNSVHCRFIYPAVFAQFGSLLSLVRGKQDWGGIGLAITLLNLEQQQTEIPDNVLHSDGFFGGNVQRELDKTVATGEFLGAVVGLDETWVGVQTKVNAQLAAINLPGWGWRTNVGDTVVKHLQSLQEWGWLDG